MGMNTENYKKLLILAYDFPPYVSVGGLRPYAWYKYLKDFGVHPIVVTRQWGNRYGNHLDYIAPGDSPETIVEETEYGTIIRTPYQPNLANRLMLKYGDNKWVWLRKLITAYYEFAQWFLLIGPKVNLYYGAKQYLKTNKVDAIIATGEPFILFRYASLISSKHNVPWIADYRDPWVKDRQNSLIKAFNIYNQEKNVRSAKLITTVSNFFSSLIKSSKINLKIEVLINGYNSANIDKAQPQNNKELRFGYAGTIYPWHPVKEVLKIIHQFSNRYNILINVDFYGVNNEEILKKFISDNKVQNVSFFPKINNDEILPILSEKSALLLFNDYSIIGTKIYDYLAVRRKIIFCFYNDMVSLKLKQAYFPILDKNKNVTYPQATLIKKTNSGVIVNDQIHLSNTLKELYEEFNEKAYIECNSIGIEKYSRKLQVEKLAKIVKEL